jgi:hypothetical protein
VGGAPAEPTAVAGEGVLGTVAVLRRYPVKSMLGACLPGEARSIR